MGLEEMGLERVMVGREMSREKDVPKERWVKRDGPREGWAERER